MCTPDSPLTVLYTLLTAPTIATPAPIVARVTGSGMACSFSFEGEAVRFFSLGKACHARAARWHTTAPGESDRIAIVTGSLARRGSGRRPHCRAHPPPPPANATTLSADTSSLPCCPMRRRDAVAPRCARPLGRRRTSRCGLKCVGIHRDDDLVERGVRGERLPTVLADDPSTFLGAVRRSKVLQRAPLRDVDVAVVGVGRHGAVEPQRQESRLGPEVDAGLGPQLEKLLVASCRDHELVDQGDGTVGFALGCLGLSLARVSGVQHCRAPLITQVCSYNTYVYLPERFVNRRTESAWSLRATAEDAYANAGAHGPRSSARRRSCCDRVSLRRSGRSPKRRRC